MNRLIMSKIYYSLIIILSLFIISSCGPGSTSSDNTSLYQVIITAEPEEAGSVSPSSAEVDNGDEIEISASPNANWMFDSWQGDHEGNTNPVVITVNGDKNITARFIERDYPLTVNVEGEGTVSERIIQPKTTDYPHGTMVELTANPSTGWIFSHWMGDAETEGNPVEIMVDEAKVITAVFVPREFDLEITIEGEGAVSEQVIDEENQTIQITASPADGWRFVEWRGDVSGTDNPLQLTLDEDKEVTAVFELREYPLTVNIEGEGTVTEEVVQARTTDYTYGTTVELTASPADGWTFFHWEGDLTGSSNPARIEVTEDKEVTAVFHEEKDFYEMTIETQGDGSVAIELESGEIADGLYESGAVVMLTANADDDWLFSHWEGSIDGSENPVSVEMNSDKIITAVFEEDLDFFDLSIGTEGDGSVVASLQSGNETDGLYQEGSVVELMASAESEWVFSNWEGDLSGGTNPGTITMDSDKSVTAVFELREYPLTVHVDGEGMVTEEVIQGRTTDYPSGTIVELTATAASGWSFVRWEGDLSGDENPVQIEITGPTEVTAVFEEDTNYFELSVGTTGSGSVFTELQSGSVTAGLYEEGSTVQLTATADGGWSFSHWDGDLSGSTNPQTITMDSDKSVTAIFEEDTEIYTLSVSTDGSGTVSPSSGDYEEGTEVELTATADPGWSFIGWEGDLSGTTNPQTITMDSDKSVTAVFEEEEEVVELFILTINMSGSGSGTVTRTPEFDEYEEGTEVGLDADADDGSFFSHWEGEEIDGSGDSEQMITMDSDKTVTAVFEEEVEETYSVSIDVNQPYVGRIQINGEEYNPSVDFEYEEGTEIEILAYPPPDGHVIYLFHQWEGDINSEENPVFFTLNSDVTLYPVFRPYVNVTTRTRSVDGDLGVGGEVIIHTPPARDGLYEVDQDIEVEAIPDAGWRFVEWDLAFTGSENPSTQQASNTPGEAVFEEIPSEIFTIETQTIGGGEIILNPDQAEYEEAEEITVEAQPESGWSFSHWEGDLTGTANPQTITIDSDKSVTANFEEINFFELSTDTEGDGSGEISPESGDFEPGTEVVLTAIPDDDSIFSHWEGDLSGSANPQTIIMDSDKDVTAVFDEDGDGEDDDDD